MNMDLMEQVEQGTQDGWLEVNRLMLRQIECPVCIYPVLRPIRTCNLGHAVIMRINYDFLV